MTYQYNIGLNPLPPNLVSAHLVFHPILDSINLRMKHICGVTKKRGITIWVSAHLSFFKDVVGIIFVFFLWVVMWG